MRNLNELLLIRYVFWIILSFGVFSEPFNPSVHCHCADDRMTVIIHTELPFKGIVYTEGHRSDCYWYGQGASEMNIAVRLGASECGVTYNQVAEDYHLILYVRQHPTIILEQDRAFNLSCSNPTSSSAAQIIGDDFVNAGLRILDKDNTKTHDTVFGQTYIIQVFLTGVSEGSNFLIKSCRAFAGDFSAKLIDEAGCSTDTSIISNIRYSESRRTAEATVQSMFRFPNARYVHFQCGVTRCSSFPCSKPNCDRRRDVSIDANNSKSREGLASTTVKVLDTGNLTEIRYDPACSYHYTVLSWMSIISALILVAVICVHVAFCFLYGGHEAVHEPEVVQTAFSISTYSTSSRNLPRCRPDYTLTSSARKNVEC